MNSKAHPRELLFPNRRDDLWMNKLGLVTVAIFFALGAFFAWFSWTQIARPQVFHVPIYNPPLRHLLIAVLSMAALIYGALGRFRKLLAQPTPGLRTPPPPWVLGTFACIWANLLYVIALLAFGIAPQFPPAIAMSAGVLLAGLAVFLLPRWTAHSKWGEMHLYGTIFGTVTGSMMLSFVGFIGGLPIDLYFKIVVDALALILLIVFCVRLSRAGNGHVERECAGH